MGKAEEIINSVKFWPLQRMLRSVYHNNTDMSNEQLVERILEDMSIIDRKFFVEEREPLAVYNDAPLHIGDGQTISQPTTVARMLIYADLKKGNNVLEIGAGSGWNAALISFVVYPGKVLSIDRFESLVENAEENLERLRTHLRKNNPQYLSRLEKINFLVSNIFNRDSNIWDKRYDRIIITAGIPDKNIEKKVEEMAQNLLAKDGILICPYCEGPIIIYRKNGALKGEKTMEEYRFVPLIDK